MNSKDLVVNYLTDNEEGMRNLITQFLNEVLQAEANDLAGAERYERAGSRHTYRNGTRKRSLKSRYGSLSLDKPLLRDIPFKTQIFERYSRVEKALENVIIESYLQGVSTRKIQDIVAHLGVEKISASYVSKIAAELDQNVHLFLSRPIETYIPYLFVDASYFKIRDGVRYVNKALLVIAGIRSDVNGRCARSTSFGRFSANSRRKCIRRLHSFSESLSPILGDFRNAQTNSRSEDFLAQLTLWNDSFLDC